MTYEEGILAIPKQFAWQAEIINRENRKPFQRIIVLGMGGSRLGADILNMARPDLGIIVHSSYQLPALSPEALAETLIIANSYSGNTAETISGTKEAIANGYNVAIVCGGGELQEIAEQGEVPHIIVPHSDLPARLNMGTDVVALAAMVDLDIQVFRKASNLLVSEFRVEAQKIAEVVDDGIPLIYMTERFNSLGYCWKVILNETAKIPAFCNRFPEVAHNEIESYGSSLARQFRWIIMEDPDDTAVLQKMVHAKNLFKEKDLPGMSLELSGNDIAEQIISSLILAHFTALELAKRSAVDPLTTPFIEEFKKHIND